MVSAGATFRGMKSEMTNKMMGYYEEEQVGEFTEEKLDWR